MYENEIKFFYYGFTQRSKVHPVLEVKAFYNHSQERCPHCGNYIYELVPPHRVIKSVFNKNRPWCKTIQAPNSDVWLISNEICGLMQEYNLTGWKLNEIDLPRMNGINGLYRDLIPQNVYCYDFFAMSGNEIPLCPLCHSFDVKNRDFNIYTNILSRNLSSLQFITEDFICASCLNDVPDCFCSDRVIDFAHKYQLEDVNFKAINTEASINYKANNWRELLLYDIAIDRNIKIRNLMINFSKEELPQHLFAELDEISSILSKPRPKPDYGEALILPPTHEIDCLTYFYDEGWMGSSENLISLIHPNEITISDRLFRDVENPKPPAGTKLLYDIYEKHESELLPVLDSIIRRAYEWKEVPLPPPYQADRFGPYDELGGSIMTIGKLNKKTNTGYITLEYGFRNDREYHIRIRIKCNPSTDEVAVVLAAMCDLNDDTVYKLKVKSESAEIDKKSKSKTDKTSCK